MPHIRHWQRKIFGKRAGTIHADTLGICAQMTATGHAVATATADDVAFAAHDIAHAEVVYVRTNLHDLADELVADDHRHGDRLLRPGVPFVNVQVRAANSRAIDADQHVVNADSGFGHVDQLESGFR